LAGDLYDQINQDLVRNEMVLRIADMKETSEKEGRKKK
jgi:hypothetical protein